MRDEAVATGSSQLHAIRPWRRFRLGIALLAALALTVLATPAAFADGGREIRMRDKCDPATFNAVLGPGACVGDGDVTFAELLATLNPADGGHDAWRFTREELTVRVGESVSITNQGGEVHSFTEVLNFGTGIVGAPLDNALPPGTPAAIPAEDPGPTFLPPGGARVLSGLTPGAHKFECLIHPWMQSTITVRSR